MNGCGFAKLRSILSSTHAAAYDLFSLLSTNRAVARRRWGQVMLPKAGFLGHHIHFHIDQLSLACSQDCKPWDVMPKLGSGPVLLRASPHLRHTNLVSNFLAPISIFTLVNSSAGA